MVQLLLWDLLGRIRFVSILTKLIPYLHYLIERLKELLLRSGADQILLAFFFIIVRRALLLQTSTLPFCILSGVLNLLFNDGIMRESHSFG